MTSKAKIEEKYELQEILGRGTFSDVKKALDKTDGSVWAVKIMSKTGNDEDEDLERRQEIIDTEIQIFKTIKHKNVVFPPLPPNLSSVNCYSGCKLARNIRNLRNLLSCLGVV